MNTLWWPTWIQRIIYPYIFEWSKHSHMYKINVSIRSRAGPRYTKEIKIIIPQYMKIPMKSSNLPNTVIINMIHYINLVQRQQWIQPYNYIKITKHRKYDILTIIIYSTHISSNNFNKSTGTTIFPKHQKNSFLGYKKTPNFTIVVFLECLLRKEHNYTKFKYHS